MMNANISAEELKNKFGKGENIQLIDVREPWEVELFNIGGKNIPYQKLIEDPSQLDKTVPAIIYCEKGIRSQLAIQRLQERWGFNNLINLSGGMKAWKTNL